MSTAARRPFSDVSDRANHMAPATSTATLKTSVLNSKYVVDCSKYSTNPVCMPSESPEPTYPTEEVFTLTPSTCVPSFLHHLGLSDHAVNFMEQGVYTCGQLHSMPYSLVRPLVASDEECQAIVTALNTPTPAPVATHAMSPSMGMTMAHSMSPSLSSTARRVVSRRRHDPYAFECLAAEETSCEAVNTSDDIFVPMRSCSEEREEVAAVEDEAASPMPSFPFDTRGRSSSWADTVEEEEAEEAAAVYAALARGKSIPKCLSDNLLLRSRATSITAASEPPATPMLDPILAENPSLTFTDIVGQLPSDNYSLDSSMIAAAAALPSSATADLGVPCTCLVQFRFRQNEFSSSFLLHPGQYVMVSGDRGQDLGLVLRVNTDKEKGYVERTGVQGTILRLAYQKEVDYANITLRNDEAMATEVCRGRVHRLGLNMEVHSAEYQYDKKKLTFYYESRSRVDFVTLLKDLYREFGCRIWMEKVPRVAASNVDVVAAE